MQAIDSSPQVQILLLQVLLRKKRIASECGGRKTLHDLRNAFLSPSWRQIEFSVST